MRVGNRDLNSQSPSPRLRTSGIPRGQRNWRVLRSSPIMCRSSVGSSLSHSRTCSRPVADRKNKTENGGEPATTKMHHERYVLQGVLVGGIFGLPPPCRAYPQNPLAKNHDDFVPALGLRHFCRINSPKHPWADWRIDWRAGLISYACAACWHFWEASARAELRDSRYRFAPDNPRSEFSSSWTVARGGRLDELSGIPCMVPCLWFLGSSCISAHYSVKHRVDRHRIEEMRQGHIERIEKFRGNSRSMSSSGNLLPYALGLLGYAQKDFLRWLGRMPSCSRYLATVRRATARPCSPRRRTIS